jgi:hypothetical protein
MKRTAVAYLLAIVMLVGIAAPHASAHVLQSDGTIGAMLHIIPDDDPMSGAPTTYELEFSDTVVQFSLPDCKCTATVMEAGKTIASKPLHVSSDLNSINTVTFPTADVYELHINGQPKKSGEFQPFILTYLLRVKAGSGAPMQSFPPLLGVGFGLLIVLVLLGVYKTRHNS